MCTINHFLEFLIEIGTISTAKLDRIKEYNKNVGIGTAIQLVTQAPEADVLRYFKDYISSRNTNIAKNVSFDKKILDNIRISEIKSSNEIQNAVKNGFFAQKISEHNRYEIGERIFITHKIDIVFKVFNHKILLVSRKDTEKIIEKLTTEKMLKFASQFQQNNRTKLSVILFIVIHITIITFFPKLIINLYIFLYFIRTCFIMTMFISEEEINENALKPEQNIKNKSLLPSYTILIPLYKEHKTVPQLIKSIKNLNYPECLLDVKIITEDGDIETATALAKEEIPSYFHIIISPKGGPQTKPKALNYASHLIHGDIVVIYDAEDIPHRNQLLTVGLMLTKDGFFVTDTNTTYSAIQCPLSAYNMEDCWTARIWGIEYHSLFKMCTKMASKLGLFIPLGGTSNHIITKDLREVNYWDPSNVTEDFDLATRLYLNNKRIYTCGEQTIEAAVTTIKTWIRQRTRWIKGFIVSITTNFSAVHCKIFTNPSFVLGFYLFGWTSIVQPVIQLIVWIKFIQNPKDCIGIILTVINTLLVSISVTKKHSIKSYCRDILGVIVYSFLIIIPFTRAIYQTILDRTKWEKTPHNRCFNKINHRKTNSKY